MIKAAFFDIDGTLVSFTTHQVPESTFRALQKLHENSVLLFIATGRAKDGLSCLCDFPFDGFITLNGQYCFAKDRILYENTIDPDDLNIFIQYEKGHSFPCGYVLQNTKIFNYRDERVEDVNRITHNDAHPAGDVSHIREEKVYQIMAFIDEQEEKELLRLLPHCTSSRWYPTFCDISPKGGTKVIGMDVFAKHFGFTMQETIAFGDGGNDLAMLEHAGISIAIANGDPYLQEISDDIAEDPDHDGIEKILKKLELF